MSEHLTNVLLRGGSKKGHDSPPKQQRIRMRIYKNAVKHDGTLIEFAADGSSFKVSFDGPLPDITFYQYNENLVTDKPLLRAGINNALDAVAQIWEVL